MDQRRICAGGYEHDREQFDSFGGIKVERFRTSAGRGRLLSRIDDITLDLYRRYYIHD
jgi:hypothetical protein